MISFNSGCPCPLAITYGYECISLIREPTDFQYKLFLVDGAHWNGQRKLKKGDINGKGGHLGCPSSYNFNLYKEFEDVKINSQGREQTNALIERCSQTLSHLPFVI